jgi:hypothetical protein
VDVTEEGGRICQVSPYAGRIEPLIGLIPEIVERNDQLRPFLYGRRGDKMRRLITACKPHQIFTRSSERPNSHLIENMRALTFQMSEDDRYGLAFR